MADTKISAFTSGNGAVATDRIAAARTPFGSGDNVYLTPPYLQSFALGSNSSSATVGFYGQTPIIQQSGAAQADIISTAAASISATQWGYVTSTQADGIVTLLREIRRVLVASTNGLGIMSGA